MPPHSSITQNRNGYFGLNASRPIAKGDLKWRDALLVAPRVNSNQKCDNRGSFCSIF
ncbi:MAG: hypothetical protein SOR66_02680 [Mediterraneibacter faecis]|nr:hypothetical protein [Mediterraneibacter faecis]